MPLVQSAVGTRLASDVINSSIEDTSGIRSVRMVWRQGRSQWRGGEARTHSLRFVLWAPSC